MQLAAGQQPQVTTPYPPPCRVQQYALPASKKKKAENVAFTQHDMNTLFIGKQFTLADKYAEVAFYLIIAAIYGLGACCAAVAHWPALLFLHLPGPPGCLLAITGANRA